jgi:beta-phosphoglucomutase-like phosphatase (HAD superfamily)
MSDQRRAIIWDLDGTLIDSSAYHWEAWQEVMTAENLSLTYEEYVADFGKRNDEILRGRLGPDLTDGDIARITGAKEERYRELVRSRGLKLLPGAGYWLQQLKADQWLQALATSSPRDNIGAVFAALGIEKYGLFGRGEARQTASGRLPCGGREAECGAREVHSDRRRSGGH